MSFGVFIASGAIGTGGVAHLMAIDPTSFEFADARRWQTSECLAAIAGARAAGASDIMVGDGHAVTGIGLLIDQLPSDVRIVRSWPRPLGQVEGIDRAGIEACVMIGQHAGAGSHDGILARTYGSEGIRDVRIGGTSLGEVEIDAMVADALGVPTVFVSGDDAVVRAATDARPTIGTCVTKQAIGYSAVITPPPPAVAAQIAEKVETAVRRRAQLRREPGGFDRIEIEFVNRVQADLLALLPGVERIGAYTVRPPAADILAARRWITFATHFTPAGLPGL